MFSNDKILYIEAGEHANFLADFLDSQGYRYGYNTSGPCQRRSGSNMPYIRVDQEKKLYNGSKGKEIGPKWHKLTDDDLKIMDRELRDVCGQLNVSKDVDTEIFHQFYNMFGKAGMKKVFDGFGYLGQGVTRIDQVNGRQRQIIVKRMKEALLHETVKSNHRLVMRDDGSALERVWVAATGKEFPISKMKDDHLHNTILMIDRKIGEGAWVIGANEDLQELRAMMEEERERRGMPMPLIPIKSLEWRKRMVDTPSIARSATKENY